jgi:Fe2+ or Zn2+ uptake regulation protein
MIKTGNNPTLFMSTVDFNKVIQALSLKTRREILRVITGQSKTLIQIYEELRKKNIPIKYRESVYKSLEKLISVGLVEKVYEKRTVLYRSRFSKIKVNLVDEKMELS